LTIKFTQGMARKRSALGNEPLAISQIRIFPALAERNQAKWQAPM
jgi:hypothetical protein